MKEDFTHLQGKKITVQFQFGIEEGYVAFIHRDKGITLKSIETDFILVCFGMWDYAKKDYIPVKRFPVEGITRISFDKEMIMLANMIEEGYYDVNRVVSLPESNLNNERLNMVCPSKL